MTQRSPGQQQLAKKQGRVRFDADLIRALEPVRYEITQLVLTRCIPTDLQPHMKNALLESHLIHARVLRDFFDCGGSYEDDMRSEDFGFERRQLRFDGEVGTRLDKDLAHLTYSRLERLNPDDRLWSAGQFLPLCAACLDFVRDLLDKKLRIFAPDDMVQQWECLASALQQVRTACSTRPDGES